MGTGNGGALMLFGSLTFCLFFAALWLVLRTAPRPWEPGVLLGASLTFYGLWYPIFLPLLVGLAGTNHLLLRGIVRGRRPRVHLALSIGLTLAVLTWFKYAGLIVVTARPLLEASLGLNPPLPDVLLPLGISFYSFQMISLAVDVARGQVSQLPPFRRYLLFVAFFPQLIAGPIVRGHELLPQLRRGGEVRPDRTRRGLWLLASGLFKKVVMGDFLLAPFVDESFEVPGLASGGMHLIAMYAFAFQIYFDFSGYTDMARGLAALLGYELPHNFREPYLSLGPSELWRRWHITLSSWFRDYVYIPLGGSRRGPLRTSLHLLIVFALSGLWHGAAWTFVLWGVYHGVWIVLHRLCSPALARIEPGGAWGRRAWVAARWLVTFHLIALGFVIFRAASASDAWVFVARIFTGSYAFGVPPVETAVVAFSLLLHILERLVRTHAGRVVGWTEETWIGSLAEGAALGTVAALTLAASGSGAEFIYFQF